MCVRALCDSDALFQKSHSHFTLHTSSHLISSQLFSPHLISSHMSSKFFSTTLISSEHCSAFCISSKLFSTHLSSSARQKASTVREKSLARKNRSAQKAFAQRRFATQKLETQMRLLPAAATLSEKTQWFALRLPPQDKSHATFMQPLQCVLQHHLATRMYLCTWQHNMATQHGNIHAAIPLRSATRDSTSA